MNNFDKTCSFESKKVKGVCFMKFRQLFLILPIMIGINAYSDVGVLSKVVDGDTVYFNDVKCRLAYIDTAESKNNDKAKRDAASCAGMTPQYMLEAGKKASQFLKGKMNIGQTYKYDVVDTDRYGRSVCLIDGINLSIVQEGYAVSFDRYIPDYANKRAFNKAVAEAKQKNRGLWSSHRNVMECMDGSR